MINDISAIDETTRERLKRWKTRLKNLIEIQLPTDYSRPIPPKVVDAVHTLSLPDSTGLAVLQLSLGNGSSTNHPSPFTILLSAFTLLIHRYTGDEDITVGSSSDSRNPLVLRIPVTSSDTFESLIERVQQVELEASTDEVPFSLLLSTLYPGHDSSSAVDNSSHKTYPPLFKVRFFNQSDTPDNHLLQATSTTTDITIFITSHASTSLRQTLLPKIELRISYNQLLFSSSRVRHILDQLVSVIDHAHNNKQTPISEIPLVTDRCRAVLPDPVCDLRWDEFRGSITDIFAENAKKFPKKTCVVESVEGSEKKRIFTYEDIYKASNLVAQYLLHKGVEREDVVTVYAYRGVDLVVAVMGVLKAGATFSVIDPAYPPERQNIYLQVAQPRAIIFLKHAGVIHPSVCTYITANLNLKCEIPALEITDDAYLKGGSHADAEDVLDAIRGREEEDVGILIGPDSIGTLSFTSGSTGIPKGVRGRHFSLTHYYPWMSQEFNLSENDRFTMLSGIAHDPIQRDIFTPLFLGAELHVPTAEDIGTPGQLAVWMSKNELTVTHLTPAMGQLLSANAMVPIPTLRNAFFVGDILTKRDCNRLQHLAPNTTIINMYGTTETQRSVSYFSIPPLSVAPAFLQSQKDVIPAGKGMQNVQLLVVNRKKRDLLCGVGEIGEIYVRAGGLAEGYLRLEDVTREKFLWNWFASEEQRHEEDGESIKCWKGKRDRLYRTGDLGRYNPSGNVECTGRADDQIKIRGFRIELGEIDTHLSQHPLVRENVTLVRRDKDEEQTLVSYFVPVESEEIDTFLSSADEEDSNDAPLVNIRVIRKYRKLIKDIRDYLKQKLPSYSVPTVFVPLRKMPLTPNGKIDKPALPFPDTAQIAEKAISDNQHQLTPIQRTVCKIWSRLLPHASSQSLPLDESFFDLGGHSILATRLIFELRKECGVSVPLGLVFSETTIRGQARAVERLIKGELNIDSGDVEEDEKRLKKNMETNAGETYSTEITSGAFAATYFEDLDDLITSLPSSYPPLPPNHTRTVFFLTGVTGFLGAFIVSALLNSRPDIRIIAHVRATDESSGLERIRKTCSAHLVWKEEWIENGRIEIALGDLEKERLGLEEDIWEKYCEIVDVVVHNGALVHWVYPYSKLRSPNVLATLSTLSLSTTTRVKPLVFISSTSVLDTDHYIRLSSTIIESGGRGILESDDLEGSRTDIHSGYGQSKWVAEKLLMEARSRGAPVAIVRPGYIVGHSETGVTNTDDFIWRLVKGCVQLKMVPSIYNIINMCPVDYVAECVKDIAISPNAHNLGVFHITHPSDPPFRFIDLFSALSLYGYEVQQIEYVAWRDRLMEFTLQADDNALYPLLHFVLDDLPTSTKAPELDDSNTRAVASKQCERMGENLMGLYLGYLVKVGFLEGPKWSEGKMLPSVRVGDMLSRSRT